MAVLINKLKCESYQIKARLKAQGFHNSDQLLAAVRTTAGRKNLASELDLDTEHVLKLANWANLARIRGIGGVFSDLLEQAGVDTVKELATRRPDNLHAKLAEINAKEDIAGRLPTLKAVKDWVAQAKELPGALDY